MDCHMPQLDGLSATERIRAGVGPNTHTPIVALTASAMEEDRNRCMAAGMDGYMSKPFSTKQLVETTIFWLMQSRIREEMMTHRNTV
jgi:CheY-like chemotaxis protein